MGMSMKNEWKEQTEEEEKLTKKVVCSVGHKCELGKEEEQQLLSRSRRNRFRGLSRDVRMSTRMASVVYQTCGM
jgi:hypothetical protein